MQKKRRLEMSLPRQLSDNLVLRSAKTEEDVERVAEFNGSIHGPGVEPLTRNLYLHHPNTEWDDLLFVEDESTGSIVSSLCLIPWIWRFEGVDLRVGEMGIVGTHKYYRRQGLVRTQVEVFKQRLTEGDYLLSQIQGIPYYYRQFGYEYALPLEGGLRLEARHAPDGKEEGFQFVRATLEDIPLLQRLYDEAMTDLDFHAVRDDEIWSYLLHYTKETEMERETWIVRNGQNDSVDYFSLPKHHFGEELTVNEVSRLSFAAAQAVLSFLRKRVEGESTPAVRLCLPESTTLMQLARALGAYDLGTYAWQIYLPDTVALLSALTPVFEKRLARSPFAGLTQDVELNFYRSVAQMRFVEGALKSVDWIDQADDPVLNSPPKRFIPLVLGDKTWRQIADETPDFSVPRASRMLVETLFPLVEAYIYTVY